MTTSIKVRQNLGTLTKFNPMLVIPYSTVESHPLVINGDVIPNSNILKSGDAVSRKVVTDNYSLLQDEDIMPTIIMLLHEAGNEITHYRYNGGIGGILQLVSNDGCLTPEGKLLATCYNIRNKVGRSVSLQVSHIDLKCENGLVIRTSEVETVFSSHHNRSLNAEALIAKAKQFVSDNSRAGKMMGELLKKDYKKTDAEKLMELLGSNEKTMRAQIEQEFADRGTNGWALYSAYTNHATHGVRGGGIGLDSSLSKLAKITSAFNDVYELGLDRKELAVATVE